MAAGLVDLLSGRTLGSTLRFYPFQTEVARAILTFSRKIKKCLPCSTIHFVSPFPHSPSIQLWFTCSVCPRMFAYKCIPHKHWILITIIYLVPCNVTIHPIKIISTFIKVDSKQCIRHMRIIGTMHVLFFLP